MAALRAEVAELKEKKRMYKVMAMSYEEELKRVRQDHQKASLERTKGGEKAGKRRREVKGPLSPFRGVGRALADRTNRGTVLFGPGGGV